MNGEDRLLDAAAAWLANLDGDAPDFDGFTAWLESDARHPEAFDAAVAMADMIADNAPEIASQLPANDIGDAVTEQQPAQTTFWASRRWMAAVFVILLMIPALWMLRGPSQVVHSSDATPQAIALNDRIDVTLDRQSRLLSANGDAEQLELAQGSAYFDVQHDPDSIMTLTVGDIKISDIGTRFSVSKSPNGTSIAVAEGQVSVRNGKAPPMTVVAGQRLDISGKKTRMSQIQPQHIAGWRNNQLYYDNATLIDVTQDMSRYTQKPVVVDASVADIRFSGVLNIGDGTKLDGDLAAILGLERVEQDKVIVLRACR